MYVCNIHRYGIGSNWPLINRFDGILIGGLPFPVEFAIFPNVCEGNHCSNSFIVTRTRSIDPRLF